MKYLIPILFIFFLAACSNSPTQFKSDDVEVRTTDASLQAFNKMDVEIWSFAVERGTAASILWSTGSPEGEGIMPGESERVPFSEIYGFEDGDEIIFHYWSAKDPGSEDIKSLIIKID